MPARAFHDSGLDERLRESGARVDVRTIEGGRLAFQWRSLAWLWREAASFDVVLAQEMLRGGVNATVVGALRGVPVVTYMGISPIEYTQARRMAVFRTAVRMGENVAEATYTAGFGSSRALYEKAGSHLGMTPANWSGWDIPRS